MCRSHIRVSIGPNMAGSRDTTAHFIGSYEYIHSLFVFGIIEEFYNL